jgi:hypothetical protein
MKSITIIIPTIDQEETGLEYLFRNMDENDCSIYILRRVLLFILY